MPFAERIVPADTDVLCESCGYTLNGLPNSGNCPECGSPIVQSTTHDGRTLSAYELNPRPSTFIRTTWRVIFDTRRFYRTLKSREETKEGDRFAAVTRGYTGLLLGLTAYFHFIWMQMSMGYFGVPVAINLFLLFFIPAAAWLLLVSVTRLASWLTALEARFWGMRLPHATVVRAMQFHTANYLPVCLLAFVYVWFHIRFRWLPDTWYLYGLCGLVIISALYLFKTYWIAMKSLMFANR